MKYCCRPIVPAMPGFSALRPLASLLLILASQAGVAQELTYDPVSDNSWTNNGNWKNAQGQVANDHPHTNQQSAKINGSATTSIGGTSITIGGLTLTGVPTGTSTIEGSLTVENTATFNGSGTFKGGPFLFNTAAMRTGIFIDTGTSVTAANTTLGVAGGQSGNISFLTPGGGPGPAPASGTFVNNGSLVLHHASSISGSGSAAAPGFLQNNGSLTKAVSTQASNVSVPWKDNGAGTISNLSSQNLTFSGACDLTGSSFSVTGGGKTILTGGGIVSGASFSLAAGSEFQFNGGTYNITAPLLSSGDGTATLVRVLGFCRFSGNGALSCTPAAPLVVDSAAIQSMTNLGAMQWRGGTIEGGTFLNVVSAPGRFVVTSFTASARGINRSPSDSPGTLANIGHITMDGGIHIGQDCNFTNDPNATILFNTGSIIRPSGTNNGKVTNSGFLIKDTAGVAAIQTDFANEPTGTVQINNNTLTLSDKVRLRGNVNVDRAGSSTAQLILGSGAGAATVIGNTACNFNAGGTAAMVNLVSGAHEIEGVLTLSGSGRFAQTAGTLAVQTGRTGGLQSTGDAHFHLNGTNAAFLVRGIFNNNGIFDWTSGTMYGPGDFVNFETVNLFGTSPLLSDGTEAHFENFGLLSIPASASLRLQNGAELSNRAGGRVALMGSGSTIAKFSGSVSGELFLNEGVLEKSGGGISTVSVNFRNDGGTINVLDGTLRFSGNTTVEDITVHSEAGDAAEFAGTGLHTVEREVKGTGPGATRLTGGTMQAPPNSTAELNFPDFVVTGGTLGGTGTVENAGSVRLTGGRTAGTVVNSQEGTLVVQGATLASGAGSTVENYGDCDFQSGTIERTVINHGDSFTLTGSGAKTLAAGAILENHSDLVFNTTVNLTLGTGARIFNYGPAVLELAGTGSITSAAGAANTRISNVGTLEKSSGGTTNITVPVDNGGTLSARAGTLNFLGGGSITIVGETFDGGTLAAFGGATLGIGAGRIGTIGVGGAIVLSGAGSRISNLPAAADTGDFSIEGSFSSINAGYYSCSGEVVVSGDLTVDDTSTFSSTAIDVNDDGEVRCGGTIVSQCSCAGTFDIGQSPGTATITGSYTQTATGILKVEIGGTTPGTQHDRLQVNGPAALGGTLRVSLYGGFLPLASQAFTIVNGASVGGAFSNISGGRVPVLNGGSFAVLISSTSVTLSDYQTGAGAVLTYDQWRAQSGFFTPAEQANDAISGPDADPDSDAISNLLEFAMGTHPRQDSTAALPFLRTEAGNHIYTWQRSRTATGALNPEISSSLSTWSLLTATPVLVSETPQIQTWAITLAPADVRNYLRLKFTP